MTGREIADDAGSWRWPDAFCWTDPKTGERHILKPDDVSLIWVDVEAGSVA